MSSTKENKSAGKNPFKKGGMFQGANHLVFELSKDLRRNMTHAEKILWMYLKQGIQGLKFRRQHPIGVYIVDFYCHKIKLIIEADGTIHSRDEIKDYDKEREIALTHLGYKIIRFTNEQIQKNIEAVIAEISNTVEIELQNLIINQKQKASL